MFVSPSPIVTRLSAERGCRSVPIRRRVNDSDREEWLSNQPNVTISYLFAERSRDDETLPLCQRVCRSGQPSKSRVRIDPNMAAFAATAS